MRNTFLDAQYRVQAGRQSFYEAQYKAVQEIEDLFGEMEGEEFITFRYRFVECRFQSGAGAE